MDAKKIKICIGLLSNRGFKGKTVLSLLKMIAHSPQYEYYFAFIDTGYTIAENRNYLAVQAIKNDCDYLFMSDDDMIFPQETLEVLISRQKDIIGVPFNVKVKQKEGEKPEKYKNITYIPEDELLTIDKTQPFEVIAIGCGVMLINTDVFKKLSQPFFGFDSYENGMTKVGEDSWFCYKATDNGYKIWAEPSLQDLGHIGDYIY